ncbi:Cytochrome c oxidase subunit 4, mitochondrial [Talaromyces atroroseus]|uniref:Cytochrome c oxidase subunit 4, mitochondrial n=1 Tax=Talaromyces atroroseus TaxID=1441469 RepID=A0A225A7J6_TALAT|nr:Cytochrome c oxidase subunit 4, mitochondrial [Talaromyces atroroseus]OKL56641.1 Cytochrome c oxidase subunit 4, mitochondrial [Talaromyces atroroseus]
MFASRAVSTIARRAPVRAFTKARPFTSSVSRYDSKLNVPGKIISYEEVKTEDDLLPPGSKPTTVPSDLEQATGLERLELLGKMQGIDVFDMRPLDASRKGTLENPIIVNGAGDEQYAGCTGYPADSHLVNWLTVSRDRPIERCGECGNVVKLNYVGPEEDPHAHDHGHGHGHPAYEEPKTFADYVKPEYWYR